jgi:hypothetical protein
MFSWLKNRKKETSQPQIPEVLGLRLGGAFELDHLKLTLIEDDLTIEGAAVTQLITAVGVVNLDEQTRILRYYTDDDGYIQVLQDGNDDSGVTEVKLVYFYQVSPIDTEQQWQKLLKEEIVKPEWTLEENTFTKVWDNIVPVAMTETTWQKDNTSSSTDQFVMVYERQVSDSLFEGLIVAGEEKIINNQVERSLVTSTYFDLTPTDFKVIG